MSCKHGNWSPCELCNEEDEAYTRAFADGVASVTSASPVEPVAPAETLLSESMIARMVKAYTDYQLPTDRGYAQCEEGMRLALVAAGLYPADAEIIEDVWGDAAPAPAPAPSAAPADSSMDAAAKNGLAWALSRWQDEVSKRYLINVHRRSLDDAWRQVIHYFGGDPDKLVGPSHDQLLMEQSTLPTAPGAASPSLPVQAAPQGEVSEPYGYVWFNRHMEHRFTKLKPDGGLYADASNVTAIYLTPPTPQAAPHAVLAEARDALKVAYEAGYDRMCWREIHQCRAAIASIERTLSQTQEPT